MRLADLLPVATGGGGPAPPGVPGPRVVGDGDVQVLAATHDSRAVEPGWLFCCVPGAAADGHDFAAAAVAAGAAALLCERPLDVPVAQLVVPSVRRAMGPVAAALVGDPSHHLDVVGVTGTNGKTTVTHLLASVLEAAGRPCGVIGTLTGARTTPEAPELQAALAEMRAEGKAAVAMEVSSHALDLHRVDGTRFRVAVFTNLSPDHLDHHQTMEAYFQAKARLFDPSLAEQAVVCTDEPHGRLLRDAAAIPTVGYGLADAADVRLDPTGSSFTWRGHALRVPLPGRFNVLNALAVATVADLLGVPAPAIAAGLAQAPPVPGRFEPVEAGQPFTVVVDYAHTPDGLAKALAAARELTGGRVIVVFGAGGDRDVAKRPLMGAAAAEGADVVVVTSDNPRSEDPGAIISAVLTGIDPDLTPHATVEVEPDRRAAIARALAAARPGDVVVLAGKGHETTQEVAGRLRPFDDRDVAAEELARLFGGADGGDDPRAGDDPVGGDDPRGEAP